MEENKMAFGSMNIGNAEAGYVFDKCFGAAGVADEETYYDPIRSVDKRIAIGKELHSQMVTKGPSMDSTVGGTYTGYSMLPPFVDPSIVDRTMRETPLVKLLPRKAIRGRSYVYNILSAKVGAQFLAEDASLSDQVDTRSTGTAAMKFLYAVGRVTGVATASQTIINLMAEDLRVKTASMNEALENTIINGNATTAPLEFTGLIQTITTNTTDNSGANVTLEEVREDFNTAFEANGIIDLAVTDGYTHNYLKGLLMDFQRNVERPSGSMDFGIPDAFMFDGVLFIRDRYMPTTAASRRIIYLDSRYLFLAVLQDYTYEELAKTNDSQKYMIKWYGTLVVNFEAAMVQRYGLA
jgi:hypothetical protein